MANSHYLQDNSFLNSQVLQTKQKEKIDKSFSNDRNGITGYAIYIPQAQDKFSSGNYFVHLCQTQHNGNQQTILYPLYYLDKFNPFLTTIWQGEFQQVFGTKFKGFEPKLLVEDRGSKYYIENKGGPDSTTKVTQKKGSITNVIEIKLIRGFMKLLEDIDWHADKYLRNLANENGRDIKK